MATPKEKVNSKVVVEEEDIYVLLDDALDDFERPGTASAETKSEPTAEPTQVSDEDLNDFIDDDFAQQLAVGMEELMSEMVAKENVNEVRHTFEKLWQSLGQNVVQEAESGNGSGSGSGNVSPSISRSSASASTSASASASASAPAAANKDMSAKRFKNTIDKTLNQLDQSSEKLDNQTQTSDESTDVLLEEMMRQMETLADNGNFKTMVEGMIEELMSKELLYEPMKDMALRYPKFLEENESKLEKVDYDRYKKQYECIQKIIAHYEAPEFDDKSETQAKEIVELMQQMQDCGQPPDGILQEMAPEMEKDENGLPKLPGDEQCTIM